MTRSVQSAYLVYNMGMCDYLLLLLRGILLWAGHPPQAQGGWGICEVLRGQATLEHLFHQETCSESACLRIESGSTPQSGFQPSLRLLHILSFTAEIW